MFGPTERILRIGSSKSINGPEARKVFKELKEVLWTLRRSKGTRGGQKGSKEVKTKAVAPALPQRDDRRSEVPQRRR